MSVQVAPPPSAQTVERPVSGTLAPKRQPAQPPAELKNDTSEYDCAVLMVKMQRAALMLGMVTFAVSILAARWGERSWLMAVFCGSLAALVSAAIGTILAKIFVSQVAENMKSGAEQTGTNALSK